MLFLFAVFVYRIGSICKQAITFGGFVYKAKQPLTLVTVEIFIYRAHLELLTVYVLAYGDHWQLLTFDVFLYRSRCSTQRQSP